MLFISKQYPDIAHFSSITQQNNYLLQFLENSF